MHCQPLIYAVETQKEDRNVDLSYNYINAIFVSFILETTYIKIHPEDGVNAKKILFLQTCFNELLLTVKW